MANTPAVSAQSNPANYAELSNCRPALVRTPTREMTLDELLASPLVHRLMERDGVDAFSVRAVLVSIARARLEHSG
jgi:hypothetical protein